MEDVMVEDVEVVDMEAVEKRGRGQEMDWEGQVEAMAWGNTL